MSEHDTQNQQTADEIKAAELQTVIAKLEEIKASAEQSLADAKAGREPSSLTDLVASADGLKAKARQESERKRIADLMTRQGAVIDKYLHPVLKPLFSKPEVVAQFKEAHLTKLTITFAPSGLPLIAVDTLKKSARRANGVGTGNGLKMTADDDFYESHTTEIERSQDAKLLELKVQKAMENSNNIADANQTRNSRWHATKVQRLWNAKNGVMFSRFADEAKKIQGTS